MCVPLHCSDMYAPPLVQLGVLCVTPDCPAVCVPPHCSAVFTLSCPAVCAPPHCSAICLSPLFQLRVHPSLFCYVFTVHPPLAQLCVHPLIVLLCVHALLLSCVCTVPLIALLCVYLPPHNSAVCPSPHCPSLFRCMLIFIAGFPGVRQRGFHVAKSLAAILDLMSPLSSLANDEMLGSSDIYHIYEGGYTLRGLCNEGVHA